MGEMFRADVVVFAILAVAVVVGMMLFASFGLLETAKFAFWFLLLPVWLLVPFILLPLRPASYRPRTRPSQIERPTRRGGDAP
jgi:hypothetical protein